VLTTAWMPLWMSAVAMVTGWASASHCRATSNPAPGALGQARLGEPDGDRRGLRHALGHLERAADYILGDLADQAQDSASSAATTRPV
jgi:hypothetical protein